jgi:hypothetical protein
LTTEEVIEALKNMKPVKFNYKQNPDYETHVGFITEDVPDLVASKGRKIYPQLIAIVEPVFANKRVHKGYL